MPSVQKHTKIQHEPEAVMIPYRVSVLASNGSDHRSHEIKIFGTYAETDDEALRTVSEVMPEGWQVDRIAGLLSRAEVERLRLAHGEVREVSSFTIGGLLLSEEAMDANDGIVLSKLN